MIAEDKRWLQVRDDYYHYLKEQGLRKLHGNEHEGYFKNRGAIINRLPWEHNVDRFVGREACRFIENYGGDGPFAMMVGFPGPHCPDDPASDFPENFKPEGMPEAVPEVVGDPPKLRQQYIDGNKRHWNGVDYTEFNDSHKQKIRAHYAGLVKHIDHEVGAIIDALRQQGLLDNTVIIFSTDHADYLGDHNLIGKASFYESAWKIPLLARISGSVPGQVCNDLVDLLDVTATMLSTAGVDIPKHMDSRPLPGLGLMGDSPRERIIGMLTDGWCNFDGEWKLAKYATGESVLFNLIVDPDEQRNLAPDPDYSELFRRLDIE